MYASTKLLSSFHPICTTLWPLLQILMLVTPIMASWNFNLEFFFIRNVERVCRSLFHQGFFVIKGNTFGLRNRMMHCLYDSFLNLSSFFIYVCTWWSLFGKVISNQNEFWPICAWHFEIWSGFKIHTFLLNW